MADIDTSALKENFGAVAARGGDDVALYFYSYLFLKYPETREMFPPAMTRQRDRLVGALVRIVTNVDNGAVLVPYLEDLGRDYRKFGTLTAHYPAVGALIPTAPHRGGWGCRRGRAVAGGGRPPPASSKFCQRNPKMITRWPVPRHDDTPDKINNSCQTRADRLNAKMREPT